MAGMVEERLEIVLPRAAAEFKKLPLLVRKLLPLCDGTRTLEKLSQAASLPPEQTKRVVARLEQLGVLSRRRRPTDPAEKKGRRELSSQALAWMRAAPSREFTDDEEQFFEKTIDHLLEPQDRVLEGEA
jgi:hypothetical protein